jgi:hypothetical protein
MRSCFECCSRKDLSRAGVETRERRDRERRVQRGRPRRSSEHPRSHSEHQSTGLNIGGHLIAFALKSSVDDGKNGPNSAGGSSFGADKMWSKMENRAYPGFSLHQYLSKVLHIASACLRRSPR